MVEKKQSIDQGIDTESKGTSPKIPKVIRNNIYATEGYPSLALGRRRFLGLGGVAGVLLVAGAVTDAVTGSGLEAKPSIGRNIRQFAAIFAGVGGAIAIFFCGGQLAGDKKNVYRNSLRITKNI